MYNKTTSPSFFKYGEPILDKSILHTGEFEYQEIVENEKTLIDLYKYNSDVYIQRMEGIAMLCVCEDLETDSIHSFVLHRTIRLNANLLFNIIPMTKDVRYIVFTKKGSDVVTTRLSTPYNIHHIKKTFNVEEIYSYYYNVKSKGYAFDGEEHNYFELTYVDNGTLTTYVDGVRYDLNEYELMLYGPGQFHSQYIQETSTASYLTVMFELNIDNYDNIINRKFVMDREALNALNMFVSSSRDMGSPYNADLMISLLRILLVHLLQYQTKEDGQEKAVSPIRQHFENELLNEIIKFMNSKIYEPLTIDDVCEHFSISRSSLQKLFSENLKISPKLYINEIKLKRACVLIRENSHTITEIALMLGFNSIHYFSRKFTQRYNVTPTEYAKKIYNEDRNREDFYE